MTARNTFYLIIALVVVAILGTTLYTVRETERAMVLRLGKELQESGKDSPVFVAKAGLHFKLPVIDSVRYIDARLQTLDIQSSRIVTSEKKDVLVDSFIKWRVVDFPRYFKSTSSNNERARDLLRSKVVDALRAEFGRRTIKEVVSGERLQIMEDIQANIDTDILGIKVIDVRIKRIDLPTEVSESVFDRMRTERERIAAEHRAKGQEKAEAIAANADAEVTIILANAKAEAARLRGDGDAKAAKIYADSYGQDKEFFEFYRSLEAYQQAFKGDNELLVIKPDSEFFKYLRDAKGQPVARKAKPSAEN